MAVVERDDDGRGRYTILNVRTMQAVFIAGVWSLHYCNRSLCTVLALLRSEFLKVICLAEGVRDDGDGIPDFGVRGIEA